MVQNQFNGEQFLILVDEKDRQWGKMEKLEVHKLGLLHRAFSVFIFNTRRQLLLQQRADNKYHSAGLWSNTCCSHPLFGEETENAVGRRLAEEFGLKTKTEFLFSFIYKVKFDNGLTEHEFDHVYFGITNKDPKPDPSEIKDFKFMNLPELEKDLRDNPDLYTEWLKISLKNVLQNEKVKKIINQQGGKISYNA